MISPSGGGPACCLFTQAPAELPPPCNNDAASGGELPQND